MAPATTATAIARRSVARWIVPIDDVPITVLPARLPNYLTTLCTFSKRGCAKTGAAGAPDRLARAMVSVCFPAGGQGVRSPERGPDGLIVYRRSSREGDWLCDLWLAERLAGALGA